MRRTLLVVLFASFACLLAACAKPGGCPHIAPVGAPPPCVNTTPGVYTPVPVSALPASSPSDLR